MKQPMDEMMAQDLSEARQTAPKEERAGTHLREAEAHCQCFRVWSG